MVVNTYGVSPSDRGAFGAVGHMAPRAMPVTAGATCAKGTFSPSWRHRRFATRNVILRPRGWDFRL